MHFDDRHKGIFQKHSTGLQHFFSPASGELLLWLITVSIDVEEVVDAVLWSHQKETKAEGGSVLLIL